MSFKKSKICVQKNANLIRHITDLKNSKVKFKNIENIEKPFSEWNKMPKKKYCWPILWPSKNRKVQN